MRQSLITETTKYGRHIIRVSGLPRNIPYLFKINYVILSFHPLVLSYLFGTVLSIIGVAGTLVTLWEKLVWGYPVLFVHGALPILAFTMGVMFLSFAILFDAGAEQQCYGWC